MEKFLKSRFSALAVIITLIGVFAWRWFTGYFEDDLVYTLVRPIDEDFTHAAPMTTFAQFLHSAYWHFLTENGRLANIICLFSSLFPRWLINIVDAAMIFVMFMLLFNVAGLNIRKIRARVTILAVLLFWLTFTWYDHMQSSDFIDNYVWTTNAILLSIKLFDSKRRFSRTQLIAAAVFTFFAGLMHEGFTCCMISYAFFKWLFGERQLRRQRFTIGLTLCLGLIVCLSSGTILRLDNVVDKYGFFEQLWFLKTRYASELWPLWLAIAITVYTRRVLGKRRFATIRLTTLANFVACAVSFVISFKVMRTARALWPLDLFCVLQTLMCVNKITSYRRAPHTKAQIAALGFIAVAYALWLGDLARWLQKFHSEDVKLFEAVQQAEQPLVYFDLTDSSEVPFYLLGIVYHNWAGGDFDNYYMSVHFKHLRQVILLPKKCEGVPLDSLKIPGSNRLCGVFPTMYSRESDKFAARAYFREFTPAVTPIDRFIIWLTGNRDGEANVTYGLNWCKDGKVVIDGVTYYKYYPYIWNRTAQNRKFVRLEDEE